MTSFLSMPRPANSVAVGKGFSLPISAQITIPAGSDWVIKALITRVINKELMGVCATDLSVEALFQLEGALATEDRPNAYKVTLYGTELGTLYSFLLEQEQWFPVWSVGVVPAELRRSVRASLRGFIPQLRTACRGVDVFGRRPIDGKG